MIEIFKSVKWLIVKFIIAGGVNTAITYGLYLLLLVFFAAKISYTIAYIAGIFFAYFLNKTLVFKTKNKQKVNALKHVILYPLIYLFQYVIGITTLFVWIDILKYPDKLGPLVAIIISLPFMFIFNHLFFLRVSNKT